MISYAISTSDLEYFLLVFVRMVSFMNLAPFYGENSVSSQFKIGLSMVLTYLVCMLTKPEALSYETLGEYGILVIKEAAVGLLIGLAATICMQIIAFTGRIVDMEIGLSAASAMDPTYRINMTISGIFYQRIFTMLLITTGMYQYIIKAVIETYTLIPVGGVRFHVSSILNSILSFMGRYFLIGFQIAMPVFAVIMVLNAVLGVLAKVAPQMNLFAVGMQMKILAGFSVLLIAMWLVPIAADSLFAEMKKMIVAMVEALM